MAKQRKKLYPIERANMTPSEEAQVKQHVKEIAEIFYRNTPPKQLITLEDIEQAVREHLLESVGPDVALFLSKREPKLTQEKRE